MLKKNAEKIESMLKKLKISWQNASGKKLDTIPTPQN